MSIADVQSVIFSEYAKDCIRVKARQLAKRSEFRQSDEDDLQQELWLTLLKRAPDYDPKRGSSNTFIDRVVNSAAGMVVRHTYRQKRALGRKALSIERTSVKDNGDGKCRLADCLSNDDLSRRTYAFPTDEIARLDDIDAVTQALDNMPEEIRMVCRHVMGGTISSAARDLGVSRHQIRTALQSARPYLERVGFSQQ